eukprot:5878143-Amphidinium_carterae.1
MIGKTWNAIGLDPVKPQSKACHLSNQLAMVKRPANTVDQKVHQEQNIKQTGRSKAGHTEIMWLSCQQKLWDINDHHFHRLSM